jgi:hypothetical protein
MATQAVPAVPAKTVEDRLTAVEGRVTTVENNHQSLLKKLRKKLAFFDK